MKAKTFALAIVCAWFMGWMLVRPGIGVVQQNPDGASQSGGPVNKDDPEAVRLEAMKNYGLAAILQPKAIIEEGTGLLGKPIEEQTLEKLNDLARRANSAANLVGMITEEYDSFERENFRYDFVKQGIAPFKDAYNTVGNRLKDIRNKCYFNLGVKNKVLGNNSLAFFYFRDCFRLATFWETTGDHKGDRYKAEVEMRKIRNRSWLQAAGGSA